MRVGQLVKLSDTFSVNFDAKNGTALFTAQAEEEVLQVVELLGRGSDGFSYARVYCPEQQDTFDVATPYLVPNSFIDNEEAIHLYKWPILPIVTVHVEVKCTDRQAILPVLPEPQLFPVSDLEKLPYYKAVGASVSPSECEDVECEGEEWAEEVDGTNIVTRKTSGYSLRRGIIEALAVIAVVAIVYFVVTNF